MMALGPPANYSICTDGARVGSPHSRIRSDLRVIFRDVFAVVCGVIGLPDFTAKAAVDPKRWARLLSRYLEPAAGLLMG
jgi:hypothetical protein